MCDIRLNIITAACLFTIGICGGIYFDSYVKELQLGNEKLLRMNWELMRENESLRTCAPKDGGRAVISHVRGRLFCEVYNKSV